MSGYVKSSLSCIKYRNIIFNILTSQGLMNENDFEPVMFGEYEFTYSDESLQYFPVQVNFFLKFSLKSLFLFNRFIEKKN